MSDENQLSEVVAANPAPEPEVTAALLNMFDEYEFAQAAGALLAAGVEARHLKDRDSIRSICRRYVTGG